jgi:hypothetical protein
MGNRSRDIFLVTVGSAGVGRSVRHVAGRWREFNIFTETAVRVYPTCRHKSGLTPRCIFFLLHCRRKTPGKIGAVHAGRQRQYNDTRFRQKVGQKLRGNYMPVLKGIRSFTFEDGARRNNI